MARIYVFKLPKFLSGLIKKVKSVFSRNNK
ncbi:MAG TPA: stage V sporulation protein SpoVM [Thermoanaerobacterales bacterium]|nr:stage V sporulation protein SpoVM [Thermoanaerobacterales bacterium]